MLFCYGSPRWQRQPPNLVLMLLGPTLTSSFSLTLHIHSTATSCWLKISPPKSIWNPSAALHLQIPSPARHSLQCLSHVFFTGLLTYILAPLPSIPYTTSRVIFIEYQTEHVNTCFKPQHLPLYLEKLWALARIFWGPAISLNSPPVSAPNPCLPYAQPCQPPYGCWTSSTFCALRLYTCYCFCQKDFYLKSPLHGWLHLLLCCCCCC